MVSLSTPNAQSTAVTVDSMPSWASAFVSVTATFGDQSLTSYLDLSYGTNTTPQVHLSLNLPDTILVYTNVFCYTDQRFELDANGTVRVIKFGYCGERTTNNVFTLTRISE